MYLLGYTPAGVPKVERFLIEKAHSRGWRVLHAQAPGSDSEHGRSYLSVRQRPTELRGPDRRCVVSAAPEARSLLSPLLQVMLLSGQLSTYIRACSLAACPSLIAPQANRLHPVKLVPRTEQWVPWLPPSAPLGKFVLSLSLTTAHPWLLHLQLLFAALGFVLHFLIN